MLTVGIVGQIATGKTTVTAEFVKQGALLVSGDEIGRDVVEKNKAVQQRLVKAFGGEILKPGGKIDRAALADKAFATEESLAQLNQIVHPPLLKELRRQIDLARRKRAAPMLVVDAALIFEWGLETDLDQTVLVDAPRRLQLKWIEGKGLTRRDALKRIQLQMSKYRQRELADHVLRNTGSKAELRQKARKLYEKLLSQQAGQN